MCPGFRKQNSKLNPPSSFKFKASFQDSTFRFRLHSDVSFGHITFPPKPSRFHASEAANFNFRSEVIMSAPCPGCRWALRMPSTPGNALAYGGRRESIAGRPGRWHNLLVQCEEGRGAENSIRFLRATDLQGCEAGEPLRVGEARPLFFLISRAHMLIRARGSRLLHMDCSITSRCIKSK